MEDVSALPEVESRVPSSHAEMSDADNGSTGWNHKLQSNPIFEIQHSLVCVVDENGIGLVNDVDAT